MARVVVITPSAAANRRPHPRVTLTGNGASITLDVTNKEIEVDDFAAEWEVVKRPHKRPLLEFTGNRLARTTLEGIIGLDRVEEDVAPRLAQLVKLAAGRRSVFIGATDGGATSQFAWNVTSARYRVRRRRRGDNAILSARVFIELTESSVIETAAKPGSASLAPSTSVAAASASSSAGTSSARRHTVAAGETLWAIADRYYGDGNLWQRLGDANGLRRASPLTVGLVLRLP